MNSATSFGLSKLCRGGPPSLLASCHSVSGLNVARPSLPSVARGSFPLDHHLEGRDTLWLEARATEDGHCPPTVARPSWPSVPRTSCPLDHDPEGRDTLWLEARAMEDGHCAPRARPSWPGVPRGSCPVA